MRMEVVYTVSIKSTDQSGQFVSKDIEIRVIELAPENPSTIYNALLAFLQCHSWVKLE